MFSHGMHALPQLVLQGQLFALAQNMTLQGRQKAAGPHQQQRADGHGDKRLRQGKSAAAH
jgi:hypothetical protein